MPSDQPTPDPLADAFQTLHDLIERYGGERTQEQHETWWQIENAMEELAEQGIAEGRREAQADVDAAYERGKAEQAAQLEAALAEVQRLRGRVHEVAADAQRRYGKTESDLAKLRHLMREALRRHNEEMVALGKQPHTYISGYGQAAAAAILRERDEAYERGKAEGEAERGQLSGWLEETRLLLEQAEEYARDLQDSGVLTDEAVADALIEVDHHVGALPYIDRGGVPYVEREWACDVVNKAAKQIFGDGWAGLLAAAVDRRKSGGSDA